MGHLCAHQLIDAQYELLVDLTRLRVQAVRTHFDFLEQDGKPRPSVA